MSIRMVCLFPARIIRFQPTPVPTRKAIFYDPAQRRWTLMRRVMDVAGVVITIVIGIFLISAFHDASLAKVLLPEPRHPYRALKEKEKTSRLLSKKPHIRKKDRGKSTTSSGVGVD